MDLNEGNPALNNFLELYDEYCTELEVFERKVEPSTSHYAFLKSYSDSTAQAQIEFDAFVTDSRKHFEVDSMPNAKIEAATLPNPRMRPEP